jgi:hypothetical protein
VSEPEAGLEDCSCDVKPGSDGFEAHGAGVSRSVHMVVGDPSLKGLHQRNRRGSPLTTVAKTGDRLRRLDAEQRRRSPPLCSS